MDTLLSGIQGELQSLADSTSNALNLDIEIIDKNLRRVACTGYARPLVGCYLTPSGVLNRAFYMQKKRSTVIEHPGNDERCSNCLRYGKCPWMGAVHSSIRVNGEPVGIFGLTATNEAQADYLNKHMKELARFADSFADLLSGYTQFRSRNRTADAAGFSALQDTSAGAPSDFLLDPMPDILTADPDFLEFKRKVARLAGYSSTILLNGETGTGKELFARGIHRLSTRKAGPFVPINCGAIPEQLIESELFGYKKGAFTGATADKPGRFLSAGHGTLFLDEVENMPLYLQQKLLRVLETREIEPLGSSRPIPVDLRLVAATNRSLVELVNQGLFREDLYHRLNVISLNIPPLRERGDDVLYLAEQILKKYNREFGKQILGLEEKVGELLRSYPWRGNVRELQNTLEYAACLCTGQRISPNDLPDHIHSYFSASGAGSSPGIRPTAKVRASSGSGSPSESHSGAALPSDAGEAGRIKKALDHFGWNEEGRLQAAASLGISRATLYRKIKKYQLKPLRPA